MSLIRTQYYCQSFYVVSQVEEDFRVELNIFRGPLYLLLYLVRKHELEVADIPIAEVLDQYL